MTHTRMHDFTTTFTRRDIKWNLTNTAKHGPILDSQFPDSVKGIKQGIYLCMFQNPSALYPVRDNNLRLKDGRKFYKEVIPRQGFSVKFGKFEIPKRTPAGYIQSGLISRMKLNYEHLHYYKKDPHAAEKVFVTTLKRLYVLDLTDTSVNIAGTPLTNTPAAFEKLWNMSIEQFLIANEYTKGYAQNLRSEWRVVDPCIMSDSALAKIATHLRSTATALLSVLQ